jgi:hypothetical protein
MKNISTGFGLVVLGLGIALHPVLSGLVAQATASPSVPSVTAAAVASAATAQAGPTIVWMGVSFSPPYVQYDYHRMWSDGRIETRAVQGVNGQNSCGNQVIVPSSCTTDWTEIAPPSGGNGFACRTDINGDRRVDGNDLAEILVTWGPHGGCEPEATYPCLDLGDLIVGAAAK